MLGLRKRKVSDPPVMLAAVREPIDELALRLYHGYQLVEPMAYGSTRISANKTGQVLITAEEHVIAHLFLRISNAFSDLPTAKVRLNVSGYFWIGYDISRPYAGRSESVFKTFLDLKPFKERRSSYEGRHTRISSIYIRVE